MSNQLLLFHNQGRGRPIGGGVTPYADKVLGYSPIAYWQLDESAGGVAADSSGNGFDGVYTGVTLGEDGIGDGNPAPLFDGANDYVDIYSTGFRDAFDGAEGTAMIWAKVFNVGVWTDGNNHVCIRLRVDGNNFVRIQKVTTNNRLRGEYEAGGTNEVILENGVFEVNWTPLVITWSKSAGVDGEVKYFRDGLQVGATRTSLGVWAGALNNAFTVIGAASLVPASVWYGYLAHCGVWNSALNDQDIADLAVVV